MNDKVKDYWNYRASLGMEAGSRDLIAKRLEIEALGSYLRDGMRVAEFGCGNGITAIEIAKRFQVELACFDFSPDMVADANCRAKEAGVGDRISFAVADVRSEPAIEGRFDALITERMIINLPDWETQSRAIAYLTGLLRPGGRYLMCENSQQGLADINRLRSDAHLPIINAPWHNLYLDDDAVAALNIPDIRLECIIPYSATYYYLSRVVNAWLAAREGKEPDYDAPVNELALLLPAHGGCAQGKLWVWQRAPFL